jgi:hypothetical protein
VAEFYVNDFNRFRKRFGSQHPIQNMEVVFKASLDQQVASEREPGTQSSILTILTIGAFHHGPPYPGRYKQSQP